MILRLYSIVTHGSNPTHARLHAALLSAIIVASLVASELYWQHPRPTVFDHLVAVAAGARVVGTTRVGVGVGVRVDMVGEEVGNVTLGAGDGVGAGLSRFSKQRHFPPSRTTCCTWSNESDRCLSQVASHSCLAMAVVRHAARGWHAAPTHAVNATR